MAADDTPADDTHDAHDDRAPRTREAWQLVRTMLDDLTAIVESDAADERELVEGLRLLARLNVRCTEAALDADPDRPRFALDDLGVAARVLVTTRTSTTTATGTTATTPTSPHTTDPTIAPDDAADPNVVTHRAAIDGRRRYRIRGRLGSTTTLSFTVLAGRGLAPRRVAGTLHADELAILPDGAFEIVLAHREPPPQERQAAVWLHLPDDASDLIVHQHVSDPSHDQLATLAITPIDRPAPPSAPTDHAIADRLTTLAWTIARLATRHRALSSDVLAHPNELTTLTGDAPAAITTATTTTRTEPATDAETEAIPTTTTATSTTHADADAGTNLDADHATTPTGTALAAFDLDHDEALVIDLTPPAARWWSVTLENVWREPCAPHGGNGSLTHATATRRADGGVRLVVAARDPAAPGTSWLDTGGRRRGFVALRWLDARTAPRATSRVAPLADVVRLDRDAAPSDA